MTLRAIAFDGDDTLWHHDSFFVEARKQFHDVMNELGDFPDAHEIADRTHIQNIPLWGYGVKSSTLSMVEAAITMTNGTITGDYIQRILNIGQMLYQHPIILLDHVTQTIQGLQGRYQILMITKGDLLAQQMKIAQSNLAPFFEAIEIVSEKDPETYDKIFQRYHLQPEEVIMIGNSVKSDILPVLELGGQAIHIPYQSTWQLEKADIPALFENNYVTLPNMHDVLHIIDCIEKTGKTCLKEAIAPLVAIA